MGFFQSLGQLVNELIEWLGVTFRRWIESLVETIQRNWQRQIEPIVYENFGSVSEVYVIFVQNHQGIVIMMIWTEYKQQQPVMVELKKAPPNIHIPTENQINKAPRYKLSTLSLT
jgi:hypothetical protein